MSKSNTFESELLALIFHNVAIALIGDAAGLQPSAAAGNLYLALHTADPGEAGSQTTNECTYTPYVRIAAPRTAAEWPESPQGTVSNANLKQWALATAGSETATHYSIGTAASGAGKILYSGALTTSIPIAAGIQPEADPGALTTAED